jgi:hypothetical protein
VSPAVRRDHIRMSPHPLTRLALLIVLAFVALTAIAGGVALILGALVPSLATVLSPPVAYLHGSPFASYLLPGMILAVVLGGVHLVAFWMLLRRHPSALFAAAVAAFDTAIWIFVELVVIPFSFLQALYFVASLAEFGLVMLALGLLSGRRRSGSSS